MPCDISGESQCTAFLTSFFIYLKKEKTGLLTGVGKTVHFTESSRIRGPFGALYLRIEGSGSHPRTHLLPLVMDIVWGGKIQKLCNTSHPYVYSCVATFFLKKKVQAIPNIKESFKMHKFPSFCLSSSSSTRLFQNEPLELFYFQHYLFN